MRAVEAERKLALKTIVFATDFEVLANRALPFAVMLANHYGSKLYVAHVIPHEAYAFAHPDSLDRVLREMRDYAGYSLSQITGPLKHRGTICEPLLTEGNVAEKLEQWVRRYDADLIVLGTRSRAGVGKMLLGSVAEQIVRDASCPVLTAGPHVCTDPSAGIHTILCAVDFSPQSLRAVKFAISLACDYGAHITLMHVVEGILQEDPRLAIRVTEDRLRALVPHDTEIQHEPEVLAEVGPVAERIANVASELSADLVIMGARGVGAFAQTASHFGSIVHKTISHAMCPVLTIPEGLARDKEAM